jgi:hypothetical protein
MAIPIAWVFTPGNDQVIQWGPIVSGPTANSPTPTYADDATGTVSLVDSQGNAVPGCTNLALTYVASSTGIYQAQILGSAFNPQPGSGYKLLIKLLSTLYGLGFWTEVAYVAVRSAP